MKTTFEFQRAEDEHVFANTKQFYLIFTRRFLLVFLKI